MFKKQHTRHELDEALRMPPRDTSTPSISELPGPHTTTKHSAAKTFDPRLKLMLKEAARTGWPEAFTDDLYLHDAQTLAASPGQEMIWILRQNGTHLYPAHTDNPHEASYYRRVIDYWSGDHKLNLANTPSDRAKYYLVNDAELIPLCANEAANEIR